MKQYVCDKCGIIINRNIDTHTFQFPRNCNYYVKDSRGIKLSQFHNIEVDETHLCFNCITDIANMLKSVEKA